MTYYPIVIPTLNRYDHFKECIESLSACTHAEETELIIGLDYPPTEKYVDGWKKIKDYLPSIKGFQKITLFSHNSNLGPSKNAQFLRNYAFDKYDACIFTEDDNVFSPCFLDYMNKCLERYKDDPKIMATCSYLNKNEFFDNQQGNTVLRLSGTFNAWGIGYWKNKYQTYKDFINSDFREKICNKRKYVIKAINRIEQFKYFMEWIEAKPELSRPCDITYAMTNLVLEKYVIYPTEYLSDNHGLDGSGVNCGVINSIPVRKIIDSKYYNITDNFSKKLDKKNLNCFIKVQKQKINIRERISYKVLILFYFIFGYKITNKLKKYIFFFFNILFKVLTLGKL